MLPSQRQEKFFQFAAQTVKWLIYSVFLTSIVFFVSVHFNLEILADFAILIFGIIWRLFVTMIGMIAMLVLLDSLK